MNSPAEGRSLTKREVVTVALLLAGGATRTVDTEHVAMAASDLAPELFAWKHFPDQVDKDLVRVLLFDARKPEYGAHVRGRVSKGWMLTERGRRFATKAAAQLTKDQDHSGALPEATDPRRARERVRLLATDAYSKVVAGKEADVSPREAESFFRVNAYLQGESRLRKLDQLANMFADDVELSRAIRIIRKKVPPT